MLGGKLISPRSRGGHSCRCRCGFGSGGDVKCKWFACDHGVQVVVEGIGGSVEDQREGGCEE